MFDGIDLQAAIERFQPSVKKGSEGSDPSNAATLVLEAIYLKALSLQKLGKSVGNKIPTHNHFINCTKNVNHLQVGILSYD